MLSQETVGSILGEIEAILNEGLANQSVDTGQFKSLNEKYLFLKERFPKIKSHAYDLMKKLNGPNQVANSAELTGFAREIFKAPVLVDNVAIKIDDASNDQFCPYHQEVFGQISHSNLNVWIPLVDVNRDTGTLKYVPDSHQKGYAPHCFYPEHRNYHGIRAEALAGAKEALVEANRGDVVVFHPSLFHGSSPMVSAPSPFIRWTLIVRYNSVRNVPYLTKEDAPMRIEQSET